MADYIKYHDEFGCISGDDASRVFEIFPKVFKDGRGSFSEVMKQTSDDNGVPEWFKNQSWIKQVNRSVSSEGTVRGCHAQKGAFCQGKLVEAINAKLYDIIIDARPDSKTYGHWGVFVLDNQRQNKLWVPRGFLHSFVTPIDGSGKEFIFQYFCDNVYSHESEFGISPLSILPDIIRFLKNPATNKKQEPQMSSLIAAFEDTSKLNLSPKDLNGFDCTEWLDITMDEFKQTGKIWYR